MRRKKGTQPVIVETVLDWQYYSNDNLRTLRELSKIGSQEVSAALEDTAKRHESKIAEIKKQIGGAVGITRGGKPSKSVRKWMPIIHKERHRREANGRLKPWKDVYKDLRSKPGFPYHSTKDVADSYNNSKKLYPDLFTDE